MWGCRGLGLNGAMVPLVLCADSMCARRSSPCTVPGGEGLIDGGYSFKEPVAAVAGIILNPDKEWRALATEIEILKEQVPAEFAFPFPSLSRPSNCLGLLASLLKFHEKVSQPRGQRSLNGVVLTEALPDCPLNSD
jgi:hypothetical protein